MLESLLDEVNRVLLLINPGVDPQWGDSPSDDDWRQLFDDLPSARGGELEVWFRWRNGQSTSTFLDRDLGTLHRVHETGRLMSLAEALLARRTLLDREDGYRFRDALPLFAMPWKDSTAESRFIVYATAGREAGNLIHTLELSPNADVWPLAGRRDAEGRAGLTAWAASIVGLERAVFGPFDAVELAQRWVLAMPVLRSIWHGDGGRLGFGPRPRVSSRDAALVLRRDWGVHSAAALRELIEEHFESEVTNAAWHWGPIASAAEFGYEAYYFSAEEAWATMVHAAREVQSAYASWADFVEAYLAELAMHRSAAADDEKLSFLGDDELVRGWLVDERHGWCKVPWDTTLPKAIPVPRTTDGQTWRVADGASLHRALLEAMPGDEVQLAPGIYRGSFSPSDYGVTLVGEAGAVLEAETDEPAWSTFHASCLRNIEMRATGTVVVSCTTFLRLDGCRITGGDDGLISYGDEESARCDYEVQLIDCVVEGSGDRGVVIEDGYATLENTRIVGTGGHALTARSRAAGIYAARSQVVNAGGAAVRAFGAADMWLCGVSIENAAGIGVLLAKRSDAKLLDVVIQSSQGRGLHVLEGSKVVAHRCRIEGSVGANVDLADCGDALFFECEIVGGEWGSVFLHPGAGAVFTRCNILGPKLACVFAQGEVAQSPPHLVACTVGESREGGAIYLAGGAQLNVMQSTLRDTAIVAVECDGSVLESRGLSIAGCPGGIIGHNGAELRLADVEISGGTASGVIVQGASALIDGLLIRGGQRGLVAGNEAQVVVARCAFTGIAASSPDTEDQERGFAIFAGESSLLCLLGGSVIGEGDDDAVQVITSARLVAEGLNIAGGGTSAIRVAGAHLQLVGGEIAGAAGAGILLDKKSTAAMVRTRLQGQAFSAVEVRDGSKLLLRDTELSHTQAKGAVLAHGADTWVVIDHSVLPNDVVQAIAVEGGAQVAVVSESTPVVRDLTTAAGGPWLAEAHSKMSAWRQAGDQEQDSTGHTGEG